MSAEINLEICPDTLHTIELPELTATMSTEIFLKIGPHASHTVEMGPISFKCMRYLFSFDTPQEAYNAALRSSNTDLLKLFTGTQTAWNEKFPPKDGVRVYTLVGWDWLGLSVKTSIDSLKIL
jgi:hypothetical protein